MRLYHIAGHWWDKVFSIKAPSLEKFIETIQSNQYQEVICISYGDEIMPDPADFANDGCRVFNFFSECRGLANEKLPIRFLDSSIERISAGVIAKIKEKQGLKPCLYNTFLLCKYLEIELPVRVQLYEPIGLKAFPVEQERLNALEELYVEDINFYTSIIPY